MPAPREEDLDRLFEVRPDRFVAARTELARAAEAAGDRAAAKRIRELRKPSAAVWLVNQIARRHRDETAELVRAGERLRKAQAAALRGGGPSALTEASEGWRAAVASLLRRARGILDAEGRAGPPPARIGATLLGASASPEAARLLAAGRLVTEVAPPGLEAAFGDLGPPGSAPRREPAPRGERPAPSAGVRREEAAAERRRAREEARLRRESTVRIRALERKLAAAEQAARTAEARAVELAKRAAAAGDDAARAAREASEARARLDRERRSSH